MAADPDDGRAAQGHARGITGWAAGRGADLDGLTVTRPSLEDIYLTLTSDTEEAA